MYNRIYLIFSHNNQKKDYYPRILIRPKSNYYKIEGLKSHPNPNNRNIINLFCISHPLIQTIFQQIVLLV